MYLKQIESELKAIYACTDLDKQEWDKAYRLCKVFRRKWKWRRVKLHRKHLRDIQFAEVVSKNLKSN
jgi:hypothetical protein